MTERHVRIMGKSKRSGGFGAGSGFGKKGRLSARRARKKAKDGWGANGGTGGQPPAPAPPPQPNQVTGWWR